MREVRNEFLSVLIAALFVCTGFSAMINYDKMNSVQAYDMSAYHSDVQQTMDKSITIHTTVGAYNILFYEHIVDGFKIKNDSLLIHIDLNTNDIITHKKRWRDIDNEIIPEDVRDFNPAKPYFWKQKIIFLEKNDCGHFYSIKEDEDFPVICWEVRNKDGSTFLYSLEGKIIGKGVPAPYTGFSMSGYNNESCPDAWVYYREHADSWFETWCNTTTSLSLPTPTTISSFINNPEVEYFYELAHGDEDQLLADSEGSWYWAKDVEEDMANREAIEFAFIGCCHGMTATGPGTFSYEFRKGQIIDTVTVGYDHMEICEGWQYAIPWQESLFENMSKGCTIKAAFDKATARYPSIATAVKFVGDTNFIISLPPDQPSIPSGPTNGKIRRNYTYITTTVDPNGDKIWYKFDWGDGTVSEWKGPYYSGEHCEESHTWTEKGSYSIRVKAKDESDRHSTWSDPLPISMPMKHQTLLERLIEWFLQLFGHHPVS